MSAPPPDRPDEFYRGPPPRQPVFNLPGIVVAAIVLCAGIHFIRWQMLDISQDVWVLIRFAFIPLRYSDEYPIDIYAWISPVTYAFLHGDALHLAVNMVWLAAFGSPLANRLGMLAFALFWVATGLAAAGLHYAMHPLDPTPMVGASGAISGMMGAAARFAFRVDRSRRHAAFDGPVLQIGLVLRHRTTLVFLTVWIAINLAIGYFQAGPGLEARIAWEAHIGGLVAGFLAIPFFVRGAGNGRWRAGS